MSGLPRELLKWLQSLDLTYSVKNIKRDFSNGFLVAEIFSRYYVQDVEMHSYDNGLSLKIKLDNWGQLKRFFNNRGIQVPEELIDSVIHSKSMEAAAELISVIYTLLTGRTISAPKYTSFDPADDRDDPAYARPNATSLLASNIRESEMSTTLQDQTTAASRAKSLIDDHGDVMRSIRETEPAGRLAPGASTSNASMARMLRGPAKPVPLEIEAAQVRFQEVRVTAVDRNIAQLRASRDPALGGGNSYVSSVAAPISGGPGPSPVSPPPRTAGTIDVVPLLTEATLPHCPELLTYVAADGQPSPRAFGLLVGQLAQLPLTEVQTLFAKATTHAVAPLAAACHNEPSNAWHVFALLSPALTGIHAFDVFDAMCDFLIAFGKALAADGSGPTILTKYALPHLLPLLKSLPPLKAPKLLALVYALVPETAADHIDAIRALQEAVDDQSAFVKLLPHLVHLETAFTDDLFNLFIYYGVMALDLDSSQLRASAIGVLAVLADARHSLILELIPKLDSIVDSWWEVVAQLGRLGATLLRHVGPDMSSGPLSLLSKSLASRCPGTQIIALAAAAPLLTSYPKLLPFFVDSLLSLPPAQRRQLLAESGPAVPVTTADGGVKEASPLPPMWPPLEVAAVLMDRARAYNLDTLEPAYTDVLTALAPQVSMSSTVGAWGAWLKTNKDYLYVALCDEELCAAMASFLFPLFTHVTEEALPTFSTLLSSLRMLCDSWTSPDALCHRTAISLLSALLDSGAPFKEAITNLVSNFDPPMRTSLAELVAKVEG